MIGAAETWRYRKIPKISPSKYKPPKPVTQKPFVKSPLQMSCAWKIALKYKEKSRNGNFTSNYKACPIDFETQISLCR